MQDTQIFSVPDSLADLHCDLKPFIRDLPMLGLSLQHPILIELFLCKELIPFINERYTMRKEVYDKALRENDYDMVLSLTERPFRFEVFIRHILMEAPIETAAKYAKFVWVDSEQPHINLEEWLMCFDYLDVSRDLKETLTGLITPLTLYRGISADSTEEAEKFAANLSWTLSREKAKEFAFRSQSNSSDSNAYVAQVTLDDLTDLYFFTDERNEQEVVLDPVCTLDLLVEQIS